MSRTHWHLRVTLESSAKEWVQATAQRLRRSASNYVGLLIEDEQRRETNEVQS